MNKDLINNIRYSFVSREIQTPLPSPLKDSLQLISDFFANNSTNKLCLVFPSKKFVTQWLSVPITLEAIKNDYTNNFSDIYDAHKKYKIGDKLILNDDAIVEWAGSDSVFFYFKTKSEKNSSGVTIKVKIKHIKKLKPSPSNRNVLSPFSRVKKAFYTDRTYPLDEMLNINTEGSNGFVKSIICLVGKYKFLDESHEGVVINLAPLAQYFQTAKIDENGTIEIASPLLLANNLSNLALYSVANSITKIIIDGFAAIQERGTDFADIDVKNVPTILITDLSEIESFERIGNLGFDFFNFTRENISLDNAASYSPFYSLEKKLRNYISFKVIKEICQDAELEAIIQKIHSIEKDESNNDLTSLKISLIQLTNLVSRIAHMPTTTEGSVLSLKIVAVESLFLRCRIWLGDSHKQIEESILLLKAIIKRFATQPPEKSTRLKALISSKQYNYIICPTEEEAKALEASLRTRIQKPKVISVADVNEELLSSKPQKAILTGWVKSSNINRILSSFVFSELTVLFYQFENNYYNSLQRRNKNFSENIKSTISNQGIRFSNNSENSKGFDDLYSDAGATAATSESSFDILEFELKLDNAQYSKYRAKENMIESIKAKRVDFDNDIFIYSSESHKFLVINELIAKHGEKATLHRKKLDTLKSGDIIAFINTDRDILAELVDKNTSKKDLVAVKQWTDLWKNLLKEYFASIGNDFKKLVDELRQNGCKKHEVTIRTWLQDENRIGPDDNADLISIALLTNSNLLNDNINIVREAIRKMTGWRMKASDFITDKIKAQIHEFADTSIINQRISIEGLGSVIVLKVIEVSNVLENIDVRYVNRLLQKEII